MWELITSAQQPYHDIDPFEMAAYLQEGYRLAQPINCPDELYVYKLLWVYIYKRDINVTLMSESRQVFVSISVFAGYDGFGCAQILWLVKMIQFLFLFFSLDIDYYQIEKALSKPF